MLRTFGILLLAGAVVGPLQRVATPPQQALSPKRSLALMRMILATEHALLSNQKAYGTLRDVTHWPGWGGDSSQQSDDGYPAVDLIDSDSGTVGANIVRITTSGDNNHFHASIEPLDPQTCGQALFSDERGVIYVGRGLGCPASGAAR
jgi:hypothetical protein